MQIFESFTFLLSIVIIGVLITYKSIKKQYMGILLGITLLALVLHIFLEKTRWQLYPFYIGVVLTVIMSVLLIFKFKGFQDRKTIRRFTLILTGLLIVISGISTIVFPVYEMPKPSGDYFIGTESFVLKDDSREELYADVGNRKIVMQVWYPTETTEGYELVPWLEDGKEVAQGLAKDMSLPSFVLNHTEDIMSNSYLKAPISDDLESYPIVVISHGWSGFRNLHTDLAEELASVGYIVISIDHTYGSVATVFSDDEVAYINSEALPNREKTSNFLEYANTLVNTYAGDVTLTIDELEKMNAGINSSRFEGVLDLTNIGLLGHSTGGGGDVAVAINDTRIKALIGMDAWVEPIYDDEIDKGLSIPTMFLRSGSWETGENNENLYRLADENNSTSLLYQIDGTTHYDFTMVYMYSPFTKYLNLTGDVEGDYLVTILKSMITNFFDDTLKGTSTTNVNTMDDLWVEVDKIK